jgi:hypothetical protein
MGQDVQLSSQAEQLDISIYKTSRLFFAAQSHHMNGTARFQSQCPDPNENRMQPVLVASRSAGISSELERQAFCSELIFN